MEPTWPPNRDEIFSRLGEPVRIERGFTAPDYGVAYVQIFACGCEGREIPGAYEISRTCALHGSGDVVQVSDRRAPMVLHTLSADAVGLLSDLVGRQRTGLMNDDGCVDMEFRAPTEFGMDGLTTELVEAGILEVTGAGYLRLRMFNCFDALTNEWY